MIPRLRQLRNRACPAVVQCAHRVLLPTTINTARPTTFGTTTSVRRKVRVRCRRMQHEHRRMLSSSSSSSSSSTEDNTNMPKATEGTTPTDWHLLYPSPSAIDVTPLAERLRTRVRKFTKNKQQPLRLIGILANEGSHRLDSEIYSDRIQQTFEEDGIDYEVWSYPEEGGSGDDAIRNEEKHQEKLRWIKGKIQTINDSSDIDGALVFYPIRPFGPKGPYKNRLTGVYYKTQDDHIRDLIHPSKDVEGLCGTKWFQIRDSRQKDPPAIYPCTALSVLRILEEYHIRSGGEAKDNDSRNDSVTDEHRCWKDQTISIVNRSEIMGRPLAVMLAEKGATVYSIDIDSILQFRPDGKRLRRCNPKETTLESCLEESTVIVAGVPSEDFRLPLSNIRQGSTIVSVSEFPNICEATLFEERPDVRYIPQVGKVTVATLSLNLMNLKQTRVGENTGGSD